MDRAVVTLVHGTFARRAHWIEPDSEIARRLRNAGYVVEPFMWSGRNSFAARMKAADELQQHLDANASRFPGLPQVIVAHSHGGNVALAACRRVPGPTPLVITLATPFLFARKRDLGASFLVGAAISLAFILATVLVLALLGDNPRNVHLQWWQTALGAVAVVELLLVGIGYWMHGRPNETDARDRLVSRLHVPDASANVLAIRAPGDEASGLLVGGQFVSWLTSRIAQVQFRKIATVAVPAVMLAVFSGLGISVMFGHEDLATTLATLRRSCSGLSRAYRSAVWGPRRGGACIRRNAERRPASVSLGVSSWRSASR